MAHSTSGIAGRIGSKCLFDILCQCADSANHEQN